MNETAKISADAIADTISEVYLRPSSRAALREDEAPDITPKRVIRTKGEQVRDIIFSCGRSQLVEVATTLKAEAPHELAILMAALKDLGL